MGIVPEHSNDSISPLCQSSIPYLYAINAGQVYRTVPNGHWNNLTDDTSHFVKKIVVTDDKIYGLGKNDDHYVYEASANKPGPWTFLVKNHFKGLLDLAYWGGHLYGVSREDNSIKRTRLPPSSSEWLGFVNGDADVIKIIIHEG